MATHGGANFITFTITLATVYMYVFVYCVQLLKTVAQVSISGIEIATVTLEGPHATYYAFLSDTDSGTIASVPYMPVSV